MLRGLFSLGVFITGIFAGMIVVIVQQHDEVHLPGKNDGCVMTVIRDHKKRLDTYSCEMEEAE